MTPAGGHDGRVVVHRKENETPASGIQGVEEEGNFARVAHLQELSDFGADEKKLAAALEDFVMKVLEPKGNERVVQPISSFQKPQVGLVYQGIMVTEDDLVCGHFER